MKATGQLHDPAALSVIDVPSNFLYSFADLLLLWAENFYTTWRLHGTSEAFRNMHNKNIYN
jgi:hypothetical protein